MFQIYVIDQKVQGKKNVTFLKLFLNAMIRKHQNKFKKKYFWDLKIYGT
jgi:hypothetical protein